MAMRLTLDMLGARYTYVTGYNSSAQAMIALQRGEIGVVLAAHFPRRDDDVNELPDRLIVL